MTRIINSIISDINLLILYKNLWSAKKVFTGIFNRITGNPVVFPLTINFLVTDKCNRFCKMCFYKQTPGTKYNRAATLSLDEIRKFITGLKDHQPIIHIGGGEPFMRDDLLDIIAEIKKKGLKCLVTTNGSLMSNTVINKLTELKVDVLIFSLYGPEVIHDEIVKVQGAYKKSLESLRYVLKKRDKHTKVLVSSIILPENILEFSSFLDDLKFLPIDGIKVENFNFLTRKEYNQAVANNAKDDFNLCPSIFIHEQGFDQKFITGLICLHKDIRKKFRNVFLKPYLSQTQLQDWYGGLPQRDRHCGFITHSVFINSNGDILPCQFFADCVLGNINNDSLEAIWLSKRYQELRKTINLKRPSICMRCCKN
jgi:MoaA/NifB/PqqE/SkfB family radical SAM enzyme